MACAGAGECDCRPLPFRPVLPSFYGTWHSWKHLSENHYFWRYYLRSLKEKIWLTFFLQILPSVVLEFTKYRVIIIHNPQDKKICSTLSVWCFRACTHAHFDRSHSTIVLSADPLANTFLENEIESNIVNVKFNYVNAFWFSIPLKCASLFYFL